MRYFPARVLAIVMKIASVDDCDTRHLIQYLSARHSTDHVGWWWIGGLVAIAHWYGQRRVGAILYLYDRSWMAWVWWMAWAISVVDIRHNGLEVG